MPRKNHNRECACGCGETSKSGFFAPGHDQKLRSRLEKRMEEAGHENGLLAIQDLLNRHLGGKLDMGYQPLDRSRPARRIVDKETKDTPKSDECLCGCGDTPKVGVWMSGHDGDYMKKTHGIVRETFDVDVSTTYLIGAWVRGICAGINTAAR